VLLIDYGKILANYEGLKKGREKMLQDEVTLKGQGAWHKLPRSGLVQFPSQNILLLYCQEGLNFIILIVRRDLHFRILMIGESKHELFLPVLD